MKDKNIDKHTAEKIFRTHLKDHYANAPCVPEILDIYSPKENGKYIAVLWDPINEAMMFSLSKSLYDNETYFLHEFAQENVFQFKVEKEKNNIV